MSCPIRPAEPADATVACEVVRRSIVELCIDDHRGDEPTLADWLENKTPSNFERWIRSERHIAAVAEREGAILGFGLLSLSGYLALLYVDPDARFSGVSKALLAYLERAGLSAGLQDLKLESTLTALRFYQSAGYSLAGDSVRGFGVTSCYPMMRHIGAH